MLRTRSDVDLVYSIVKSDLSVQYCRSQTCLQEITKNLLDGSPASLETDGRPAE